MKKQLTLIACSLYICYHQAHAQSTGINNVSPNKYAALDIQNASGINQGILIPRLKSSGKSGFGYGATEQGMIMYGADTDSLYYWTGSKWLTVQPASAPPIGPWTKAGSNVEVTSLYDNVGIGVTPAGTKLEIRGIDASPTYLALRITNSLAKTLMTVSNAGDISFPALVGKGVVIANSLGALSVKKGNPITGVGAAGKVAFYNTIDSISYNTNFHWDNTNARLGIGTAAPTQTFSVAEKFLISGTNGAVSFTDPTGSIQFPAIASATNPMIYMFASGTVNSDRMVIGHSPGFPTYGISYSDVNDNWHYTWNGTKAVTIGNGTLGIGNSTPLYNLDVTGSARITDLAGPGSVTVNANGVLSVNKVAFSAYQTTSQSLTSTGMITFDFEEFDIMNSFTGSTFSAPTSGLYQFNAHVRFNGFATAGQYMWIAFYVNNSNRKTVTSQSSTTNVGIHISSVFNLAAGDDVTVYYFISGATTTNGGIMNTWFNGYQIY